VEEQKRRAEADKLAAITALEQRSRDFMAEKEANRRLEQKIASMQSQLLTGGAALQDTPAFRWVAMPTCLPRLPRLPTQLPTCCIIDKGCKGNGGCRLAPWLGRSPSSGAEALPELIWLADFGMSLVRMPFPVARDCLAAWGHLCGLVLHCR
jgi:hypothetical protein